MSAGLDFQLDDLEPADPVSEFAEQRFRGSDFTVLAEHHTAPGGSRSFVVAHDRSATWGVPGQPQIVAIKVARDVGTNTFTFESSSHPTVSFAQNWLTEHGCPPEPIAQVGDQFMKPADDLTRQIEQKLRTSGDRYRVFDSHTSDFDPSETWTLTHDSTVAQAPIRVFLEEGDFDTHTYTVREGAFPDEDAARNWLADRSSPLPRPPEDRDDAAVLRSRAALTRSADATGMPKDGRDAVGTPPAGTVQRPAPGRSV